MITPHSLKWILAKDSILSLWSQMENIISYYKNIETNVVNEIAHEKHLSNSIFWLTQAIDSGDNKTILEFIVDQIKHLTTAARRYNKGSVFLSFMIYNR